MCLPNINAFGYSTPSLFAIDLGLSLSVDLYVGECKQSQKIWHRVAMCSTRAHMTAADTDIVNIQVVTQDLVLRRRRHARKHANLWWGLKFRREIVDMWAAIAFASTGNLRSASH